MTAKVLISGFVIGIGFRAFVKSHALKLGLKGFVKNTHDGKVEAEFIGDKNKIDEMIRLCKKGPFLSEVKDFRVEFVSQDKKYSSFDIIH